MIPQQIVRNFLGLLVGRTGMEPLHRGGDLGVELLPPCLRARSV
jgi:hypothetical protein